MTTLAREQPGLGEKLKLVAGDIKLAHSVFAMPFAVLAAVLARPQGAPWGTFAGQLALVVVCMVLARTWAMLVNRLADADIDAENTRTARRLFASGRMNRREGWWIAAGFAAAFLAGAAGFGIFYGNWWPTVLGGPVLGWIAFYSYTKRFTWACHLFLGGALAASPVAAGIAVDPSSVGLGALGHGVGTPTVPCLWWLCAMVVAWVAGFDVIYALQDLEFDQARGLRSIPARLGARGAIWVSRALHAASLAALVLAWRSEPRLGWVFGVGVAAVGCLLMLEHAILARRGKAGLDMAFFTVNGVVSVVLGLSGCVSILI